MKKYLTKAEYKKSVKGLHTNWDNYEDRWLYHRQAIKWLKELKPEKVLEIGGLGIKLREDSDTLDFDKRWHIEKKCTYNKDIREIPWGISKYDCIVALRVFHHTDIKKTFTEAKKHAPIIILALPSNFNISELPELDETIKFKPGSTIYLWK